MIVDGVKYSGMRYVQASPEAWLDVGWVFSRRHSNTNLRESMEENFHMIKN